MNLNIEKKQIDLINEFISVHRTCNHCLEWHRRGDLTFSDVEELVDDKGKSSLFRLKQMCHDLFRNGAEVSYKEKFYDITVGYIFHEAMKLRECIYQLEYYNPRYSMLVSSPELTPAEKKVIHEFDALIMKAKKRVNEGLKEVRTLAKDMVVQVRDLIKLYKDNYLLPRFILENERPLIAIYGKTGYKDLLDEMYENGRATLILKAAVSYLESEYFQIARGLLQKVIKIDRSNANAKFLFLYASAYNCYLRNRSSMARIFAHEALAMPQEKGMEAYANSLRGLLPDLAKEINKTV